MPGRNPTAGSGLSQQRPEDRSASSPRHHRHRMRQALQCPLQWLHKPASGCVPVRAVVGRLPPGMAWVRRGPPLLAWLTLPATGSGERSTHLVWRRRQCVQLSLKFSIAVGADRAVCVACATVAIAPGVARVAIILFMRYPPFAIRTVRRSFNRDSPKSLNAALNAGQACSFGGPQRNARKRTVAEPRAVRRENPNRNLFRLGTTSDGQLHAFRADQPACPSSIHQRFARSRSSQLCGIDMGSKSEGLLAL